MHKKPLVRQWETERDLGSSHDWSPCQQVGVLAFNTSGSLLASGGLDGAHPPFSLHLFLHNAVGNPHVHARHRVEPVHHL